MSSTTTETQSPPELRVFTRVASIPMIYSSWETLNGALSSNAYTRSSYTTAKDLSSSAYKYTEPIQIRFAPLLVRADGIANMAVDAVESRYPYPFKAKPEEVATHLRERKESATTYMHERVNDANKAIDENVKSPAVQVAQDLDQRFAPIVDYFEIAVSRLNNSDGASSSSSPDAKYQYQRAIALSRTLKDNLYEYSNEQLKQLQTQSFLAQRATETAQSITTLATSSITSAQTHIHALSDNMLCELRKLQASTTSLSASLQSSAATTFHNSTSSIQAQIPLQIQQTCAELSAGLSSAVTDLNRILTSKDISMPEKASLVSKEVRERVTPLLENMKKSMHDVLTRNKPETTPTPKANVNGVNGSNGHASEAD